MKTRFTSQKQLILGYLKSVRTHPSAETIFKAIKPKLPSLSLGTVYRNLEALKNEEKIKELLTKNLRRFDGDLSNHHHFLCEKCYQIFDLKPIPKINKKKIPGVGLVKNYQLYFQGLCQNCLKKN